MARSTIGTADDMLVGKLLPCCGVDPITLTIEDRNYVPLFSSEQAFRDRNFEIDGLLVVTALLCISDAEGFLARIPEDTEILLDLHVTPEGALKGRRLMPHFVPFTSTAEA